MKIAVLTGCFVLRVLPLTIHADPVVQPNDSLAIVGDSITAQHLYSADIEDYFLMCQPVQKLTVCQFGWAGEDARACLYRLPFDILPFKPTVVTTCYGMNDGRYTNLTNDIANTYRTNQTAIVESLKKAGVRVIVVGSPKPVDLYVYGTRNGTDAVAYNKNLAALSAIAKDVAAKENVLYADVNGAFTAAAAKAKAQYGPTYNMAGDGVHPGPDGHLVMAYAFLKALGCDGNIGTITVDLGAKQATGSPGQEIVSYLAGTVTVKSTRYPYCFAGGVDRPDGNAASMIHAVPFNEDLNRYLLVVKNLNSPKANITWGGATKVFTADQLAHGINLAAEFAQNNPFMPQFTAVDNAVHIQEDQEQGLTQDFMFQVPRLKAFIAPGADAALDEAVSAGIAQHVKLFNTAASQVVPVTHTIKIEPSS
jgi:lysophospholipase L1-like esterase